MATNNYLAYKHFYDPMKSWKGAIFNNFMPLKASFTLETFFSHKRLKFRLHDSFFSVILDRTLYPLNLPWPLNAPECNVMVWCIFKDQGKNAP